MELCNTCNFPVYYKKGCFNCPGLDNPVTVEFRWIDNRNFTPIMIGYIKEWIGRNTSAILYMTYKDVDIREQELTHLRSHRRFLHEQLAELS